MTTNKPKFILIHGLMREHRHWGEFTHILKSQHPDVEIITLDTPGNGRFYKQTSPGNISSMTDALRQQLRDSTQLNLIAISMGGMIAIDWMNRFPNEINSAVLINTSLCNYSSFYRRLRWVNYFKMLKTLFQSAAEMDQYLLALTTNNHANNPDILKSWQQWRQQHPISKLSAFKQLLASAKFSSELNPHHPILIAASKNDHLVDYRCSVKIHEAWKTEYQQHATAGHDLALDDPEWLSQKIQQWFSKL